MQGTPGEYDSLLLFINSFATIIIVYYLANCVSKCLRKVSCWLDWGFVLHWKINQCSRVSFDAKVALIITFFPKLGRQLDHLLHFFFLHIKVDEAQA